MAKMVELGIPEDQPEVLQVLGRLAIAGLLNKERFPDGFIYELVNRTNGQANS